MKSVSTLWAVADPEVAAVIERAHQAAVQDAVAFIEKHALFTRTGPQGIRQVTEARSPLRSPTGTAGRATLICTPMSQWRTRYKPSMGGGCRSTAGCCSRPMLLHRRPTTPRSSSISERPWVCGSPNGSAKRPIREIVGVDPRLNQRCPTRRAHINTRRGELSHPFQKDHGRLTDPNRSIAPGAASDVGDPRRQTRTPIPD